MARSAAATSRRTTARPRRRPAPARARPGGIRWDRVGRLALLLVLGVILFLYAAPLERWVEQRRTASEHATEVRRLEDEHTRLKQRAGDLTRPDSIEREARRLGMVKQGERAYVIENLPKRR